MPHRTLRHAATLTLVASLALATAVAGAGPAGAASPEDHPFEVSVGTTGIQAPSTGTGGLVSFRVRTDDPKGRHLQLLRLHDGATIDRLLADLADSVGNVPATRAAGVRAVRGEADALGGAIVTPQVHEQFTEEVAPGAVYLVDLTALRADPAHPVVKRLDLSGTNGQSANQARFPDGMVIARDTPAGPRFQTEDFDHAHLAYLMHNDSAQLQAMELRPVGPDTTDDQVRAYFQALAIGLNPQSPFTGPGTGFGALSGDRGASVQAHGLAPGRYALLSLIPDEETGQPQVVRGMHRIVTLQ
ncbi:hypothetical protein OG455_30740 [Kitasatospora sp. NBC_01287]|uniref:hypothetical protein n=1 Tax=Kitasatospora sp. NBC_01287 TaxID=2903573 RepID=UPI00225A0448|nr:hypothetical protein [Kitasatospora sp. NBC_01287]MCX4749843.1 hypothetical protein [Kitasatospora sp. NBC_01287]